MAKAIARVQTQDRTVNQLQENIKQAVDPLLSNALAGGNLLQSIALTTGSNSINHKLGQTLVGWFLTRLRGAASVYDTQASNPNPTVTLTLVSSADVTVDLYVF